MNRLIQYLLLGVLTCACVQDRAFAEASSLSTSRKSLRNEILLWDNPQLEIKGDSELCFLFQRNNHLVRHVVTSCDTVFFRLLERLYETGIASFPRERRSFLVESLSRYFVHALHDIRTGTFSDKDLVVESRKIFLLLLAISEAHPEYFSGARVKQIVSGSLDAMFPLFLRVPPEEYSRKLFYVLEATPGVFDTSGAMVLRYLLMYQYADTASGVEALKRLTSSGLLSLVGIMNHAGAQTPVVASVGESVFAGKTQATDRTDTGLVLVYLFVLMILLATSMGGYVFICHLDRPGQRKNTDVVENAFAQLTPTERAELRNLRKFFNLHPTEGVASLHSSYRVFVRKLHPDIVRDNGESFISLQERYNRARLLLIRLEDEKHQRLANSNPP
jgi:hypothetical protein